MRSPSTPPEVLSEPRIVLRTIAHRSDVEAVRRIAASTGYFSDAEVEIALELIEDRLARGDASDYRFVFADDEAGNPVGFASFGPIACTVGSFDLYWIAVHDDCRGRGIGRLLLKEAERLILREGGRRIYVETSSRPQYEPTRQFYLKCGYHAEATISDFYAPGDSKIIFVRTCEAG